jgi:hypothetical protein
MNATDNYLFQLSLRKSRRYRSRYVKVINEDGASLTTKAAVKQLRYISRQG